MTEAERRCPGCGQERAPLGQQTCEQLDYVPGLFADEVLRQALPAVPAPLGGRGVRVGRGRVVGRRRVVEGISLP
jgi:hypothetical protein